MMYNVEVVLDAVQNTYNTYKAGYEAEPESKQPCKIRIYTRKDAWVLGELGLCDGAVPKKAQCICSSTEEEAFGECT